MKEQYRKKLEINEWNNFFCSDEFLQNYAIKPMWQTIEKSTRPVLAKYLIQMFWFPLRENSQIHIPGKGRKVSFLRHITKLQSFWGKRAFVISLQGIHKWCHAIRRWGVQWSEKSETVQPADVRHLIMVLCCLKPFCCKFWNNLPIPANIFLQLKPTFHWV